MGDVEIGMSGGWREENEIDTRMCGANEAGDRPPSQY